MSHSAEYDERLRRIERRVTYIGILIINIFTAGLFALLSNQAEKSGGVWGSAASWVLPLAWLIGTAWLTAEFKDDGKK